MRDYQSLLSCVEGLKADLAESKKTTDEGLQRTLEILQGLLQTLIDRRNASMVDNKTTRGT